MTRMVPLWLALAAAMTSVAGCESSSAKKKVAAAPRAQESLQVTSTSAAISNTDPCAMRLHDLCGTLLLYYATYHRLPQKAAELGAVPGSSSAGDMVCPVSRQPYIYNAVGIPLAKQEARLILYDPAPSHAGMRLGISIVEPQDNSPLIARVIAVPESTFASRPAAQSP